MQQLSLSSEQHQLLANHFKITVGKYENLYRYGLTFQRQPDDTKSEKGNKKVEAAPAAGNNNNIPDPVQPPRSDGINSNKKKRVIALLIKELKTDKELAKIPMATDYSRHIITAKPIQQEESRVVAIDYYDEYRPGAPANSEVFKVTIKQEKILSLKGLLDFLKGDPNRPNPAAFPDKEDTVTAMNLIFSYRPYQKCFPRFADQHPPVLSERSLTTLGGRIFYDIAGIGPSTDKPGNRLPLDSGIGFTRSVRSTFSSAVPLNLNVNTKTSLFYRQGSVQEQIASWKTQNVGNQWQPHHREDLLKFLKGVSVRTQHRTGDRIHENFLATITDLAAVPAHQEPTVSRAILLQSGQQHQVTVRDYFNANHNRQYPPNSPVFAVIIGGGNSRQTFPADLLAVVPGQVMRKTRELPPGAVRNPMVNKTLIVNRGVQLFYGLPAAEGGAPEFDFRLEARMLAVPVRMLEVPILQYRRQDHSGANPASLRQVEQNRARYGSWDLRQMSYFRPAGSFRWTIIELTLAGRHRCSTNDFNEFQNRLNIEMRRLRMSRAQWVQLGQHQYALPFADLPRHHNLNELGRQEGTIRSFLEKLQETFKLDLVVVLLPEKDMELYAAVKRVGDQDLGLATVCHVLRGPKNKDQPPGVYPNMSPGLFSNLSMKINLKTDTNAVNQSLAVKRRMLAAGTMILGIDVTHAGAAALNGAPSVAAVVGSVDAEFSQWPASLRENAVEEVDGKKRANERVMDLKDMVTERLKRYWAVNHKLPERLVVYRDGLSEGQFQMCLEHELPLIQAAVDDAFSAHGRSRGTGIPMVLICAVKRHHTRFFAESNKEEPNSKKVIGRPRPGKDYNFNPLPGTMVTEMVTYGQGQDFFLISQNAQIGTARPTHYVILKNTTGFSRDDIAQAVCFVPPFSPYLPFETAWSFPKNAEVFETDSLQLTDPRSLLPVRPVYWVCLGLSGSVLCRSRSGSRSVLRAQDLRAGHQQQWRLESTKQSCPSVELGHPRAVGRNHVLHLSVDRADTNMTVASRLTVMQGG